MQLCTYIHSMLRFCVHLFCLHTYILRRVKLYVLLLIIRKTAPVVFPFWLMMQLLLWASSTRYSNQRTGLFTRGCQTLIHVHTRMHAHHAHRHTQTTVSYNTPTKTCTLPRALFQFQCIPHLFKQVNLMKLMTHLA